MAFASTPVIQHIQGAAADAATTVTTSGLATTGSDLIVIAVYFNAYGTPATLSDSLGNNWEELPSYIYNYAIGVTFFYCAGPTSGAGHTFTAGGGSPLAVAVVAFSGASAAEFVGATGHGQYIDVLGLDYTPSEDGCLFVTAALMEAGEPAVSAGFTDDTLAGVTSRRPPCGIAYQVQDDAERVSPTWTASTGGPGIAGLVVFRPAATGGGGGGGGGGARIIGG